MYKGIIDTHAHLDDEAFAKDRDYLIKSFANEGIEAVINSGASKEGVYDSIELAHQYDLVYASIGIHPDCLEYMDEAFILELKELAKDKKVLAIGEIGLDYHNMVNDKAVQKKWFRRQVELAIELDLPVVIHSRDAALDTQEILLEYSDRLKACDIHCYSYSAEIAQIFVKAGFYFGIGGVITFKNAKKLVESLEVIPIENILLETDAPYLAPDPHRGKRNSSNYLPFVVEKIAEIKGLEAEEVVSITRENAKRFYGI